jgi:hypothetical protein
MPRAGFEPATPATKRPQTYGLDRPATGIGSESHQEFKIKYILKCIDVIHGFSHYAEGRTEAEGFREKVVTRMLKLHDTGESCIMIFIICTSR